MIGAKVTALPGDRESYREQGGVGVNQRASVQSKIQFALQSHTPLLHDTQIDKRFIISGDLLQIRDKSEYHT